MNERKIRTKAVNGPGGIKCPCCSAGGKGFSKRLNNRILRRRAAASIREEVGA